jgi:hypothetical protein
MATFGLTGHFRRWSLVKKTHPVQGIWCIRFAWLTPLAIALPTLHATSNVNPHAKQKQRGIKKGWMTSTKG